jgi:hypothetical protein
MILFTIVDQITTRVLNIENVRIAEEKKFIGGIQWRIGENVNKI